MAEINLAIALSMVDTASPELMKTTGALASVESAATHTSGAVAGLGTTFEGAGASAIAFGAGMLGLQVGEGILEGISSAITGMPEKIEQLRITMETFTGSATIAATLVEQIQGLGTTTPFHFEALAQTAKTLIALGAPAEQVAIQVKDIATAVAAVGGGDSSLQAVAVSLSRIQETGVLDARIMRQLTTEQIPAWNILADTMHKTVPELQDMIKHGQISSDVFLAAFHQWATTTAGDALAKQIGTISGALVVLQNESQASMTVALAPLTDRLTALAASAARMGSSTSAQDWANTLAIALEKALTVADRGVSDLNFFAEAAGRAGNAVVSIAPEASRPGIIGFFSDLGSTMASTLVTALPFEQFISNMDLSINTLGQVMNGATPSIYGFGQTLGSNTQHADGFGIALENTKPRIDGFTEGLGHAAQYTDGLNMALLKLDPTIIGFTNDMGHSADVVAAFGAKIRDQTTLVTDAYAKQKAAAIAATVAQNALNDPTTLGHAADAIQGASDVMGGHTNAIMQNVAAFDAAEKRADAAAKAYAGIGTSALASLPGLSALDMAIAGTSSKLAAVQLQIEQKIYARMSARPVTSIYQEEALLQEQLKIEQLQKTAGFAVGTEAIKISNADLRAAKHGGVAAGAGGVNLANAFAPGAIVVHTPAQADKAGSDFGAFLKSLIGGGGGRTASTSLSGMKN